MAVQATKDDRSAPAGAARPLRRTQAERSAATRRRLLDAAIACLNEHGYVGATTIAVAARAGLSRGAMLHHFGDRAELMREIGREVLRQSEEIVDLSRAEAGEDALMFVRAFDVAWTQYQSPVLVAGAEILMACRADPDLKGFFDDLYEIARQRTDALFRSWAAAAGVEPGERLDAFLDLVAVTMSGCYFQATVGAGAERVRRALDQLAAIARSLAPASAASPARA